MCPRSTGRAQQRRASRGFDEQIHQRLLDGDPIAPSELAEIYLQLLIDHLEKKFKRVPEHDVMQAAADAVLNYAERPERFDPARLNLEGYLTMSAQGDLLNALAKHSRRRQGPVQCPVCGAGRLAKLPGVCPACGIAIPRGTEATQQRDVHFEAVAEAEVVRNTWREPSPAEAIEQSEKLRGGGELMQKVLEAIADPRDRELVRMMLGGERKTAAYSAILGLEGLSVVQQQRIVKQHKDRLMQQLRRLRKKLHERRA